MKEREAIINNYIDAYNNFDVDRMIMNFSEDIVFENVSNGEINMSLAGIQAFKEQALEAKNYFSTRSQTIQSMVHENDETEIEIAYQATVAIDLPNGLKKGNELNLSGRSRFRFLGNKIAQLTDFS